MKKNIFKTVVIVFFLAFFGLNVNVGVENERPFDLSLKNIEAMAQTEDVLLYIFCLEHKASICVYQGHVVLECYYSPH